MARVSQEVRNEVQVEVAELSENDPDVVSKCGLCNRTLYDNLIGIQVRTGAPLLTVCDIFAGVYSENKREEDKIEGRVFKLRIDRINKANEKELSARTDQINSEGEDEKIKHDPCDSGGCSVDSQPAEQADATSDELTERVGPETGEPNGIVLPEGEPAQPEVTPKLGDVTNLDELVSAVKSQMFRLSATEQQQIHFYRLGLESFNGCHAFRSEKPEVAVKRLIDKEKFDTKRLAKTIVKGMNDSDGLLIRDIDTLIEHLRNEADVLAGE